LKDLVGSKSLAGIEREGIEVKCAGNEPSGEAFESSFGYDLVEKGLGDPFTANVVSCIHDPERNVGFSRMIEAGAKNGLIHLGNRNKAAARVEGLIHFSEYRTVFRFPRKNLPSSVGFIPMIGRGENEGSDVRSLLRSHGPDGEI
jgi:hypothetical protein